MMCMLRFLTQCAVLFCQVPESYAGSDCHAFQPLPLQDQSPTRSIHVRLGQISHSCDLRAYGVALHGLAGPYWQGFASAQRQTTG